MSSTADNPSEPLTSSDVTADALSEDASPLAATDDGDAMEVEDNAPPPPPEFSAEDSRFVRLAVEAAVGRKAEEIMVLHLAAVSDFTDYFMICSGSSERQVKAITDAIVRSLRDHKQRPLHVEGEQRGQWVLIDYGGEMVIHVFLEETRQFYALERLWGDAPNITQQLLDSLDDAEEQ